MSIDQVIDVVEIAIHKLPYMESLYEQVTDQINKTQRTRQGLANDIAGLERKLSVLDKTAFSCEQERMRTEQRVHGLTDKKNRLEMLIANTLNGEDYSKLKQIIKQNVKAGLSENKKLIQPPPIP
jgi:transcription termination factor NusB